MTDGVCCDLIGWRNRDRCYGSLLLDLSVYLRRVCTGRDSWGCRRRKIRAEREAQVERINWETFVDGRSELFLIRDNGIWLLDRYE